MSPLNISPTHKQSSSSSSSSTSTTPTLSELTLIEDPLFPEPIKQKPIAQNSFIKTQPDNYSNDEHCSSGSSGNQQQNLGAINTDYESSAPEDIESSFPTIKYKNADYALLSYSRTHKLDKLQTLLEAKIKDEISLNLNFKGQQKQNFSWSALHLACYFGHIQIVELLLSKEQFRDEININIQNNSGDTPLHKATLTNRVQIVQLLLSNGANVFIKNCDGLRAKQLTSDNHIVDMLSAAEQVDRNKTRQDMFKAVDNGDLKKLQDYFENFSSYLDTSETIPDEESKENSKDEATTKQTIINLNHTSSNDDVTANDIICQITDERGNTLLHLAAMRGFKAICVYLLEQGFDPFRKNDLGQTCIDLSSYQLRQLFTTVKPANSRLKKLSNQRVSRFEGPLLKKVRILGWKQIYVVLENGVILLFNNRLDSMNKSRRGYKYLESATCEPDINDPGVFTVCFSDKSRATFLVTSEHLSKYSSFKFSTTTDQDKSAPTSTNQVDLVRQKWIDLIRDHIRYSTNFIKSGLKLNDYDDENYNYNGDLSSLNHLLPVDTIKSFMQEARAHYSILERHAESLCNLVQSINSSSRLVNSSFETPNQDDGNQQTETQSSNMLNQQPAISTSSRLLGFIRSSRQTRNSSISGADDSTSISPSQNQSIATRKRNNSLTNEFIQDNWHCILFHLRLLMESTENTKVSMAQALALIEHQEQLRQNKIQDQDERCRVLEDSLHALARDHHELEKSISMSQIYNSAAGCRSMSMSTDLNEYFDAFEDFDDEKTMTPNSMPSDEDLNEKIQNVINEEENCVGNRRGPFLDNDEHHAGSSGDAGGNPHHHLFEDEVCRRLDEVDDSIEDEEEDDDVRSNCSALTIETISDLSVVDAIKVRRIDNSNCEMMIDNPLAEKRCYAYRHRTRLPAPMVPRDQVSIWSILKNCIGKELSKITMPVVFNEPLTMLQRTCEGIQYSQYLQLADESDDPVERMELICAFIVAGLSANCHRIIKPFNPLLYETYEINHELEDGSNVRSLAQQVSHHPPITAVYAESEKFTYNGSVNPKLKFWGRSIEIQPDGHCRIYLKRHKESYLFKTVSCSIHNIIVGKLWFEHSGPLDIKCYESKLQANLVFKSAGWFSNDLHRFDGVIVSIDDKQKKFRYLYGKWSDYIKSADYSEYENYMRENQQKLFKIPDRPDLDQSPNGLSGKLEKLNLSNSVNNNSIQSSGQVGSLQQQVSIDKSSSKSMSKSGDKKGGYTKSESTQSLDIPNSRTLWRLEAQYLEEYYNFTFFTMKLNELTPELANTLPKTDSRFRQDVRKLEEGDLDGAASEKQRLEEKQRAIRAKDVRFKDPSPDFLLFELIKVPYSKEKFWTYKGGYWESKCNQDKFPELF